MVGALRSSHLTWGGYVPDGGGRWVDVWKAKDSIIWNEKRERNDDREERKLRQGIQIS